MQHTSYAIIDVYDDHLKVRGFGRETDRTLAMRKGPDWDPPEKMNQRSEDRGQQ